jgi:hypothetical protein
MLGKQVLLTSFLDAGALPEFFVGEGTGASPEANTVCDYMYLSTNINIFSMTHSTNRV